MSPSPDMTAILQELAAGRIDAAEAARRLDALNGARPGPTASPAGAGPESPSPAGSDQPPNGTDVRAETSDRDAWAAETDRPQRPGHPIDDLSSPTQPTQPESSSPESASGPAASSRAPAGVQRITIRAVGRRVRIIGESSVATLSADGPHVLRRNGSILEVSSDGELGASLDGFSILRAPRSLDDIRALGLGKELFLRVNPAIAVDVEVTAGSLHTERVPHLGKVRVTAGAAKLLDVSQVDDALVQAGSATVKGRITVGRSRVRVESGSLSVALADDSDVTITSDAQLGKVNWAGGHSGAGDEVVMGRGSARLDIEVVMGHAQVKVGSGSAAGAA